ncbi:phage tail terminator protein [Bradyrhizobium sp.]|uniref:phage tail terminator protein n=1 Tax=Bradyrhizobium sp. TaxID=376 RepID=UPI0039E58B14
MSSHRKKIRHAVVEALSGNISEVGSNVFASRVRPISEPKLPAISVYTLSETSQQFDIYTDRRTLTVAIHIQAREDDELDDVLDDIAFAVERIMSENQWLGALCSSFDYTGCEIKLTGEGDNQHGGAVMTYDAIYDTEDVSEGLPGPGVPDGNVITPFEIGDTKYKVPPSVEVSAEDQISLPQ